MTQMTIYYDAASRLRGWGLPIEPRKPLKRLPSAFKAASPPAG
jgi:hypothetical protein